MKISLNNLQLSGVSACVPKNKIEISDFYDAFGKKEVDRIAISTGIKELRIAPANLKTSDLCVEASFKLISELNVCREDIGAIVFVSQTPDYIMPSTSCVLQHRLGLKKEILAFDINYGCSGYIYGLFQAAILINSGSCRKVLLCVGDTISQHLNPTDHKSRLVFGDAGSASLIEKGNDKWTFDIRTDGSGFEDLIIHANEYLHMNGAAIMEFALREVKGVVDSVLKEQNKTVGDLSAVVLHQANTFMLQYLKKKLRIENDIAPIEVSKYGNTGPASIPLAMCSHYSDYSKTLNLAVLSGFGVGLSWGAVLLDISSTKFTQVYEI